MIIALTVIFKVSGIKVYTVLSGSMEPAIKIGSIILVKDVAPEKINKGDVITYKVGNLTVTHRVNEINQDGKNFVTKGDANKTPDGASVDFNNIIGTPVFTIPFLGYLLSVFQSSVWTIILALFLIAFFTIDIRKELLKKKKQKDKAIATSPVTVAGDKLQGGFSQ